MKLILRNIRLTDRAADYEVYDEDGNMVLGPAAVSLERITDATTIGDIRADVIAKVMAVSADKALELRARATQIELIDETIKPGDSDNDTDPVVRD